MVITSPRIKKALQLKAEMVNQAAHDPVIQGRLRYNGKIYSTLQELARNDDAWEEFNESSDPDRKRKPQDADKLYDLNSNLQEVNIENLGNKERQQMQEKVPINSNLAESLTRLAKEKHAECCHEVATNMQDAFNLVGKTATVFEIC